LTRLSCITLSTDQVTVSGGRLLLPCHRSQARTRWCFAGLRILAFLVLPISSFLTGGLFFVQKTASALLDRWTG